MVIKSRTGSTMPSPALYRYVTYLLGQLDAVVKINWLTYLTGRKFNILGNLAGQKVCQTEHHQTELSR